MKEYIFLIIAAFLFSVQFLFQKAYQVREGESLSVSMLFAGLTAAIGIIYVLIMAGFRLQFSLFSFLLAIVYGIVSVSCTYCCVKALKNTDMSTFSAFMMLGGMLLPFVAGLAFFHEPLKYSVFICCALIILALVLEYLAKKGSEKKSLVYCFIVFVLNGLCGVLSKTQEYFTEINVSSQSYMFYCNLTIVVIALGFFIFKRQAPMPAKKISILYAGLYSITTTVANFLILVALKVLPASVNYPFITGGTVLFSAFVGIAVLKEKMKPLNILAVFVAVLGVVLLVALP